MRHLRNHLFGNVVLSRYRVTHHSQYDLSWRTCEPRACQRVDLEVAPGQTLHVYNVHLGTAVLERRYQAPRLASYVHDRRVTGPKIILGDFNEWMRGLATKTLSSLFESIDIRSPPAAAAAPTRASSPSLHLDHIYYEGQVEVRKRRDAAHAPRADGLGPPAARRRSADRVLDASSSRLPASSWFARAHALAPRCRLAGVSQNPAPCTLNPEPAGQLAAGSWSPPLDLCYQSDITLTISGDRRPPAMMRERELGTVPGPPMAILFFVILVGLVYTLITGVEVRPVAPDHRRSRPAGAARPPAAFVGPVRRQPQRSARAAAVRRLRRHGEDAGPALGQPVLHQEADLAARAQLRERAGSRSTTIDGNPIEIAAVVVWRVVDTAEAVFQVDDYENFVQVQTESALRNLATSYPYDAHDERRCRCAANTDEVAEHLKKEIQDRLARPASR